MLKELKEGSEHVGRSREKMKKILQSRKKLGNMYPLMINLKRNALFGRTLQKNKTINILNINREKPQKSYR